MTSQNKKIFIIAISIFIVSFTTMVVFLEKNGAEIEGKTSVFETDEGDHEASEEELIPAKTREKLDKSGNPVFVVNSEGKIAYLNQKFCDFIAEDCNDLKKSSLFDLVHKDDVSALAVVHAKIIQKPEKKEALGPFRMMDGENELLVLLAADPQVKKDKIKYIIFSVTDITEKIEEFQNKDQPKWLRDLYPKIKEYGEDGKHRFTVEKISYQEE